MRAGRRARRAAPSKRRRRRGAAALPAAARGAPAPRGTRVRRSGRGGEERLVILGRCCRCRRGSRGRRGCGRRRRRRRRRRCGSCCGRRCRRRRRRSSRSSSSGGLLGCCGGIPRSSPVPSSSSSSASSSSSSVSLHSRDPPVPRRPRRLPALGPSDARISGPAPRGGGRRVKLRRRRGRRRGLGLRLPLVVGGRRGRKGSSRNSSSSSCRVFTLFRGARNLDLARGCSRMGRRRGESLRRSRSRRSSSGRRTGASAPRALDCSSGNRCSLSDCIRIRSSGSRGGSGSSSGVRRPLPGDRPRRHARDEPPRPSLRV